MKIEEHCAESVKLFGEEYREVHEFLDEFFATPLGARQHVVDDLKGEGWREGDRFPEDEADYIRMGLF
jgi:hypothetical protein